MIFRKAFQPQVISQAKVFCIGRNKTGTTTVEGVFKDLGYKLGNQPDGERLLHDWANRDFRKIINLCQTAEAFQDIPFALPITYQVLDQAFPSSRFILTVRDSAEQWYESLVRWHSKFLGLTRAPVADDLKRAKHISRGWLWAEESLVYGINETSLYDKTVYIAHYNQYNQDVQNYFSNRPGSLLVLNVSQSGALKSLCQFLGKPYMGGEMPHLNASST